MPIVTDALQIRVILENGSYPDWFIIYFYVHLQVTNKYIYRYEHIDVYLSKIPDWGAKL